MQNIQITKNLQLFIKTNKEADLYHHFKKIKKYDKAAASKLNAKGLDELFKNNIPAIYLDNFLQKDPLTDIIRQRASYSE